MLAGVLTGVVGGVLAGVLAGLVVLAAGEVGVVAALLEGWAGLLAGAVVLPGAVGLEGLLARARPSAVPPAASRKARVSTTGSRALRRREDRGAAGPVSPCPVKRCPVGTGAGPIGPVADGCQVWASTVWVGLSYPGLVS